MKVRPRISVLFALLPFVGIAQETVPTASDLGALKRFALRPTARVSWSKDIERIKSGDTTAVVTAIVVEDASQTPRLMRGIRIDLSEDNKRESVYVAEDLVPRLVKSLDDALAGYQSFFSRGSANHSKCFGSGEFLRAVREGVPFFSVSQCAMADGWFGLSASTAGGTFRFTGLDPSPFSSAITRAKDELIKLVLD